MIEQSKEIFENLNLSLSIEKVMHDDWDYIFFLKIFNKSANKRKVKLCKSIYLTKKKEQLDQDDWKRGYFQEEDVLFGNAFKIAGLEFKKEKLKSVNDGDIIYTTIELTEEGNSLSTCFKKNGNDWEIFEIEYSEIEIKLTPEQFAKKILNKIERLDAFEENIGVTFENISVQPSYGDKVTIFIEMHSITGTRIKHTVHVHLDFIGKNGSILETRSNWISSNDFFGFYIFDFEIYMNTKIDEISKIRIYPR